MNDKVKRHLNLKQEEILIHKYLVAFMLNFKIHF